MKRMLLIVVAISVTLFALKTLATQPAHSEVRVRGAQTYGTTGVYVRVFQFIDVSTGSDITYFRDTVNGDTFTINTDGVYAISYTGTSPFADILGVSINQSPVEFLEQLAQDSVMCRESLNSSLASCSAVVFLHTGDVVRAHRNVGATQGCNCDANADERFIVSEVKAQ